MHIIVTGASGFIASHVIPHLLSQGHKVTGIDRRPCALPKHEWFTFVQQDINDTQSFESADAVVHLACTTNIPYSIQFPVETTFNNVVLTVRMLELARFAHVKKFIYPSTAALYGTNPLPWREDMPAHAAEPYSLQKYMGEQFCEYYAKNGLPVVILRFFQVFGENPRSDTVLYKFFQCRKEGKPIPITQTASPAGSSSAKRDFIYAGDIARAVLQTILSDRVGHGEIINIASGYNYPIREIAELISDKIEFIPKRGFETDEHLADVTRARDFLGFRAQTDIKAWLKEHMKTL